MFQNLRRKKYSEKIHRHAKYLLVSDLEEILGPTRTGRLLRVMGESEELELLLEFSTC